MAKLICLMPTFNKEETLAKAIESVVGQKTDFDYKLIILDDCSTDNSNKIANEYKEKCPEKIEIIRNKTNLKLLKTIMNGYNQLKEADYFCVLDADDYYTYDKKFQEAVDFLDKNKNYSMYMTNVLVKKSIEEQLFQNVKKEIIDFDFNDRKKGKTYFVQTSGVIYRNLYFKEGKNKEFEKVLKLTFPECYRADGFRYEWYLKGGRAIFINKVESVYNYDENGIWSKQLPCEQRLFNAKLLLACSEFILEEQDFYIKSAKTIYKEALKEFRIVDEEIFNKNKDLINEIAYLLDNIKKERIKKWKKALISLIPNKTLRTKLKAKYR